MAERIRKVNELIKHEVAESFKKVGVEGFVTVKAVETSRNMKHADVWIGIVGGGEEEILAEIEEKRREIQLMVNKKIMARNVPTLSFKIDHSGEHAQKIEELLKNDGS